jgi:hypothetical protein
MKMREVKSTLAFIEQKARKVLVGGRWKGIIYNGAWKQSGGRKRNNRRMLDGLIIRKNLLSLEGTTYTKIWKEKKY